MNMYFNMMSGKEVQREDIYACIYLIHLIVLQLKKEMKSPLYIRKKVGDAF